MSPWCRRVTQGNPPPPQPCGIPVRGVTTPILRLHAVVLSARYWYLSLDAFARRRSTMLAPYSLVERFLYGFIQTRRVKVVLLVTVVAVVFAGLVQMPELSGPTVPVRLAKSHEQSTGYVLALNYRDQITSATRRLFCLQCWATLMDMSVVEPFLLGSRFGLSRAALRESDKVEAVADKTVTMRFGDIYDLDQWNHWANEKYGYAPIARWSEFITMAPKTVVYVHVNYHRSLNLKETHDSRTPPQIRECFKELNDSAKELLDHDDGTLLWGELTTFLQKHSFHFDRAVCIDFQLSEHGVIPNSVFTSAVLQGASPHNVTLIFSDWRGLSSTDRHLIRVNGTHCRPKVIDSHELFSHVQRSLSIRTAVEDYINKYIGNVNFTAVLIRSEMAMMGTVVNNASVIMCFKKFFDAWKTFRQARSINSTFLSVDVGRFGTSPLTQRTPGNAPIFQQIEAFFSMIYGTGTSLESWEQSFVDVSPVLTAGIVAMIHQEIAARSTCLLLLGGGGYQTSTKDLYIQYHSGRPRCIRAIKKCKLILH